MLVIVAVAAIAAVIVISAKVRYLVELEPPAQYDHPYVGRVDERVMPVAEVRTLCRSVAASGRFVACAWVSKGTCHKRRGFSVTLKDRANPDAPFDVKPFKAWLAEGRVVRRGQKSVSGLFHKSQTDLLPGKAPALLRTVQPAPIACLIGVLPAREKRPPKRAALSCEGEHESNGPGHIGPSPITGKPFEAGATLI
jgi:hypothetical protein